MQSEAYAQKLHTHTHTLTLTPMHTSMHKCRSTPIHTHTLRISLLSKQLITFLTSALLLKHSFKPLNLIQEQYLLICNSLNLRKTHLQWQNLLKKRHLPQSGSTHVKSKNYTGFICSSHIFLWLSLCVWPCVCVLHSTYTRTMSFTEI